MSLNEFFALFASGRHGDEERAYELKAKHLPSRVYKYRAPNERALRGVQESTVWLSAASLLNDPYESSLVMDCEGVLRHELRKTLLDAPPAGLAPLAARAIADAPDPLQALFDAHRASGDDLTDGEAAQLEEQFRNSARVRSLEQSAQLTALLQQRLHVCSFSTVLDSLVMWAHYADSHRGFCIEYSLDGLNEGHPARQNLFPVRYADARIDITGDFERFAQLGDSEEFGNAPLLAVLQKSTHWSYEAEWRIVFHDDSTAPGRRLAMPKPAAIYLGARMQSEYREQIVRAATSKGIPIYEMRLAARVFALEAVPLSSAREIAPSSKGRPAQPSWEIRAALVILVAILCNELLPVVFGKGAHATWDWAFIYVTMRFILIPGSSVVALISALLRLPSSRGSARWWLLAAMAVFAAAVFASWFHHEPLLSPG